MYLLMLGLSYASAPVEVRETAAFSGSKLTASLANISNHPDILEAVILSTCNRTELYAVVPDATKGRKALTEFVMAEKGLSQGVLDDYFYFLEGPEVINHLYRVAAGLESQILGEGQILGQVKDAHAGAQLHHASGTILDALFRFAVSAGKRVRHETDISRGAVSVASAALELARDTLGELRDKTVLLLGTGKMSELAARLLSSYGISELYIANRTMETAQQMAQAVGGTAVPFFDLRRPLEAVDIVICCTGAPHYILKAEDLLDVFTARANRPLLMLDLSVPRNLDPEIGRYDGVIVHDIDDLAQVAERNRQERASLVDEVERILTEEMGQFQVWIKNYQMTPTISSLRHKMESLRDQELERFWDRHRGAFSPEQQAAIEEMTRALLNKVLHNPTVRLKTMSSRQQYEHAQALTALFNLQVEDIGSHYRRQTLERRMRPSPKKMKTEPIRRR